MTTASIAWGVGATIYLGIGAVRARERTLDSAGRAHLAEVSS